VTSPISKSPRRRGRPRRRVGSGAEPREEILQRAASLFATKGIGATRITDIAEAVGVTAPTIYYYYDDLDAIVEALLRYVVDESAAFATHEADRSGPCAERLQSLVRQHVSRLTSGPYDLWFVAGLTEADAARFPRVATSATRWRRAVVRLVETGVADGELRPVAPPLALAMISGVVYGALQLRHARGQVDADEVARFAVCPLLRSI
jgi:AcrR family transcriptional regulator